MVALAAATGLDVAVPTCGRWTVRDVLAHQTMVHRWAAANLRGEDADAVPKHRANAARDDLLDCTADGVELVIAALREAPDDVTAMVFLNDAPAPRAFWARRQAHETTIHAVDVLAAAVGRLPAVADAPIEQRLAVDGIDELLCGFFTRGRCRLFDGERYRIGVVAEDADEAWLLDVDERLIARPADVADAGSAAVTITGTAAGIYLSLWNRADEAAVSGRPDLLERWRTVQRIRWS